MKQFVILAVLAVLLLSGCSEPQPEATDSGIGTVETPGSSTPGITGDAGSEQPATDNQGTGVTTQTQPEAEPQAPDDAPGVMASQIIVQSGGTARFVAGISGSEGVVISFAGQGNNDNTPPGQENRNNQGGNPNTVDDTNATDDTNSTKGKGKGKPDDKGKPGAIDLNGMTGLEITVGEVSLHLSRSFGTTIIIPGDTNDSIPDTNDTIPDLNNTVPDTNSNQDVNAQFSGEDQNVVIDDTNSTGKIRQKWIIISSGEKTFDLLQLQTTQAILADTEIPAGKYTQIRMEVISAVAIIDGNRFEVTVPPKKLMLHGVFDAEDEESIFMSLAFDVDKSVKVSGNGKITLRPTIRLKILENAEVDVQGDEVEAEGEETGNTVEEP